MVVARAIEEHRVARASDEDPLLRLANFYLSLSIKMVRTILNAASGRGLPA